MDDHASGPAIPLARWVWPTSNVRTIRGENPPAHNMNAGEAQESAGPNASGPSNHLFHRGGLSSALAQSSAGMAEGEANGNEARTGNHSRGNASYGGNSSARLLRRLQMRSLTCCQRWTLARSRPPVRSGTAVYLQGLRPSGRR